MIRPAVGLMIPEMAINVEDFPAPLAPISVTI
jgi:hypothetical protein